MVPLRQSLLVICNLTRKAVSEMKVETREVRDVTVTITLTGEEAEVLVSVVGNITGPANGPRGVMDRLYDKLQASGVSSSPTVRKLSVMQLESYKKGGE